MTNRPAWVTSSGTSDVCGRRWSSRQPVCCSCEARGVRARPMAPVYARSGEHAASAVARQPATAAQDTRPAAGPPGANSSRSSIRVASRTSTASPGGASPRSSLSSCSSRCCGRNDAVTPVGSFSSSRCPRPRPLSCLHLVVVRLPVRSPAVQAARHRAEPGGGCERDRVRERYRTGRPCSTHPAATADGSHLGAVARASGTG